MARSRELRVQVVGDTRGLTRAFGTASNSARRFGDDTEKSSRRASAAMGFMTRAAGAAGVSIGAAGLGAAVVSTVKVTADFEKKLSSLKAVTSANAREMQRFRKQALQAGLDTAFSAREAADAQNQLAKGGLSVAQIMKGGLKSALALAAAGELELGDAATYTVNAMKLFNLRGKDTMRVADGLAQAANSTTADVGDFGMALTQGGTAAKAAGLNFKETVVALEALAEIGIKNSDAGTSLKTALMQLANPTLKAQSLMKELNLEFFDGAGNFKDLADVSSMLQDRFKGLTKEQRLQAAGTLVGRDGMRTLLALYDAGPKKLEKWERAQEKTGIAAEVARKKQANLAGAWEQFTGALETAQIEVGTKLLPVFTKVVKWGTRFIEQMVKGKGAGGDFVDTLKDIGGALEDIWNFGKKIPPEVWALMGITVAGVKANKMLGGLPGKALGGLGGLGGKVLGKAAPVPVFVTNPGFGGPGGGAPGKGSLGQRAKDFATKAAPIAGAGARLMPVVGAAGVLYYIFSKSNKDLPTGAGEPTRRSADRTPSGGRNVGEDLAPSPNATRKVEGMGDALKRLAQRGRDLLPTIRRNTDAARNFGGASDKMAESANRNRKRLDGLKDSSGGFRGAAAKAVDTANKLRGRLEAMGGAARKGDTSVGDLKSELAGLKDKKIKLQVALEIATSDFTLEPLGDGWGIEGAVRKQAGIDIKKGKINPFGFISGAMGGGGNLMGADPAGAIYAAIGSRFGLAVSSGLRPGAITSSGNTSLHASGRALDIAGSASGMLAFARFLSAAFGSRLRELIHTPMGWSIKNGARVAPYAAADHYDHVHVGFQRGGIVPGTGSGDKVTVGARVEPGEGLFVLNRNATSALQQLNEAIPRFAKGGWSRTPINVAADAARKAGFRGRDLVNMVAIAGRESSWNPRAANYTYPDHSIGLWQSNQLAHKGRYGSDSALMNPYTNAKAAYALFRASGLQPWVGLSYGNASQHLDVARAAVLETKGGGTPARKGKGKAGDGAKKPQPRLGAVTTYETDLARADRILDRAGDIDPTNRRDVAAVGGKLLLLGNRKFAIKRRLKTIRKALKRKLTPAKRRRLLDEQASLISELGGIESTSRELHESMHPEAGEESTAAEDQAAAAKELAEQIKALKESIDEQNRITSSTAAIGLREAQRALADMISGQIGGLVGQRARSAGDGVVGVRY